MIVVYKQNGTENLCKTRGVSGIKVIIAEKPSVASNIASALNIRNRKDGYYEGIDYYITWAFGHLLELYDTKDYDEKMVKWDLKNFPFIPDEFRYKIKTDRKTKKVDTGSRNQLNIIKALIGKSKVNGIILATDWDREGQIIGDIILDYVASNKKVERLLLNEWTDSEVLKGLESLKSNSELKPVSDAGICRQLTDWSIGINLTTVSTLMYGRNIDGVVNIGRVLLPTLKIVYDRDMEIKNFVSRDFFKLQNIFKTQEGDEFIGMYYENNNDKFLDKSHIDKIKKLCKDTNGEVVSVKKRTKNEYAPPLFNLTGLQGHITSKYTGFTSEKVLKLAQALYEKKFITYPRTASTALEESLVDKTKKVLDVVKKGLPYEGDIKFTKDKRIFNNKKVDGHSAITPTYIIPNRLTKDEQIVYDEIKDRFVMQFMPISKVAETVVQSKINNVDIKGVFVSRGNILITEGWKKVQGVVTRENTLPDVKQGDKLRVIKTSSTSHKTSPPLPHTEKTILSAMENCGRNIEKEVDILNRFSIGTPATRADTISKLKTANYVKARGKSIVCTDLGIQLVDNFPIKQLLSLEYTGKLEKSLSDIEKGELSKERFLEFIFDFTKKATNKIKEGGGFSLGEERESLGVCPECGNTIEENEKVFGCNGWKEGCRFGIWKNDKFLGSMKSKPTKEMVQILLRDGEVEVMDLISKKGNKFNAILSYKLNPETGYYNWDMRFPARK